MATVSLHSSLLLLVLLFYFSLHLPTSSSAISKNESERHEVKVFIVYMDPNEETPEQRKALHVRTLAAVLGSEEEAKKAIIYNYVTMNAFAAKLNKQQVDLLTKQPGVLAVEPSRKAHIDDLK